MMVVEMTENGQINGRKLSAQRYVDLLHPVSANCIDCLSAPII